MDYGLTPQQLAVINALSAGTSTLTAAEEAGIHRNTIANWRRNSLGFQYALAHAHYDRALAAREQAEGLLHQATQTIRAILEDPAVAPAVRLRAALAILRTAVTPPEPKKQVMLEIEKLKVVANPEPVHISAQPRPVQPESVQHRPAPAAQPETSPNLHNSAQQPRAALAIGRNQLCPCGSNVKYKRCCLNKPASNPLTAQLAA